MRNKIFQAQLKGVAFALRPATMSSLLEFANSETPRSEQISIEVAQDSVEYQKQGSVAVISIDGAMYKKDISGMCMSVASYDQMIKMIDRAEADNAVKTILFRVDTGGGAVAGADEVGERIFNSKKKTVTLYENMGASGGIWVFSASDEVYATETTMLGSIGVVVSYMEENEDDGKIIDIVSKNAQNKRCSLNGDCQDKIQAMLNSYEDIFYSRVMRNTGFTALQIRQNFNNGDMIFASQAKEDGFIKDVVTFDKLLKSLNTGSTLVPSVSVNTTNIIQGADMELNQANFDILLESRTHLNDNIKVLNTKLEEGVTALEAKTEEMTKLAASHKTELSEAEGKLDSFKTDTIARVQEGITYKATAEVIVEAIKADDSKKATSLIMAHVESTGRTIQTETEPAKGSWDGYSFKRGK